MTIQEFVVGPGVLEAMKAAKPPDEPRSDETYIILVDGNTISQTFGKHAVYYWLERENKVERIPFE